MPTVCALEALRIDAAGYPTNIIEYCDEQHIQYAIRARSSAAMRVQIEAASDSNWLPLFDQQGEAVCIPTARASVSVTMQKPSH